ncbi:MAG TPA: HlyD family efflux transporter periplasmic adaptor subunit [Gemmatimonadales bacterium]|jgi:multidrug resistance efflux pump|nr:HlyD family efflux transporter periplasmic adaptor subunit [Gemmatimonadales bacterium]
MDIKRDPKKNYKKWILIGASVAALVVVTVGLMSLKPAAPTVDAGVIYTDTVERGEMVLEVRGPGTLIPEDTRFITAVTTGRVEKIHLLPGTTPVEPETVILELSNPDVEIQTLNADRQLTDAQSQAVQLKTNLNTNKLAQASAVADLKSQYLDAKRRADAGAELLKQGLIIPLDQKQAQDRADALAERVRIEEERLKLLSATIEDQIKVQEEQVGRLRSIANFQHALKASMVVRAGIHGVLREVPLQSGQYATAGTTLARIDPIPLRLKAQLRVPENQAKDLAIGQKASIDTRNGFAPGHVSRIDPASTAGTVIVDVALEGTPPNGARSDLSVDGVIEIARLKNVLFTGRPAFGQQDATIGIFKLVEGGRYAQRVTVRLGRTSVTSVEIKDGLAPGDIVILSDMSRWDNVDRVRIK